MTEYLRKRIGNFDLYDNSQDFLQEGNESLVSPNVNWINLSTKRFIDLIFAALFMLTIGWWLFPIVAILIKLDSSGPIFYRQMRVGLNNSPFNCYKFRSMLSTENSDLKQVTRNDPRVTKIGRVLRKTSIDELPQVFNVIYGNMSFVGPRPLIQVQNKEYSRIIKGFKNRHLLKPGITGLAQAKGYRGENKISNSAYFRYKLDMYYIKNWSISLDFKIIWITAKAFILGDKNAY